MYNEFMQCTAGEDYSQEALDASAESFQKIMADAQNYIKTPPTIVTGECSIWRNMASFPAGKLSDWSK